MTPVVRRASAEDLVSVVATTTAAFVGDPAWDFILGPGNLDGAAAFAEALVTARVERGTVWVADDGAAVAMWDRVGVEVAAGGRDPWPQFRPRAGEQVWARLSAYDAAVKAAGPARPYWYLGVLATHPDRQGEGLARAVLQPGIEAAGAEADGDGWDCWLETSKPENKPFYAARGFTDVVPVSALDSPATWWLRRPRG